MIRKLAMSLLAILSVVSTAPAQQDAQSVLAKMRARQVARWAGVDNYTVMQKVNGSEAQLYYEKIMVEDQPAFRIVPPGEIARRQAEAAGQQPPTGAQLGEFANASELVGKTLSQQLQSKGAPAIPALDPGSMMMNQGALLRATANAEEDDGRADAAGSLQNMRELGRRARLIGKEQVDGRQAFLLRADDLSDIKLAATGDGNKESFTIESLSIWIDAVEYVPLRSTMDLRVNQEGKAQSMTIEKINQDYRRVGSLYEPFRQVMRVGGLVRAMSATEKAKIEKAKAEMQKAKSQLEKMPPAQRRMVEQQMESALSRMEQMSAGGAVETTIEVSDIKVNQGLPARMPR